MNAFRKILIEQREKYGLSLREASQKIGISHTYLCNLERGVDPRTNEEFCPTPKILKKIAEAYELDYYELMFLCGYVSKIADEGKEIDSKYLSIARNMMECEKKNPKVFAQIMEKLFEDNDDTE